MNAPVDVLNGMIHNLVSVVSGKALIAKQEVGIKGRTSLNMLANLSLQDGLATAWHNSSMNLAATLKALREPRSGRHRWNI